MSSDASPSSSPVLLAVDGDADALERVRQELSKRYGTDYKVMCEASADAAMSTLQNLNEAGRDVAVVLADQDTAGTAINNGLEFLGRTRDIYQHAKCALLVGGGSGEVTDAVFRAMALGQIDYYVAKPSHSPDERFHRVIGEFVDDWVKSTYGQKWTSYPIDRGLSETLQETTQPGQHSFDVIIIGAGPAGIAAAVYAASEGLSTLVLERKNAGGQARSSSMIRNYLGFPRGITGRDLSAHAYEQARMFGATFHKQAARSLRRSGTKVVVTLSDETEVVGRTVILATGAQYNRLPDDTIENLIGRGVYYGGGVTEGQTMQGKEVFVAGGGNSAAQAAIYLSKYARNLTLLVRGGALDAKMSTYLVEQIKAARNVHYRLNTKVVKAHGAEQLDKLDLCDSSSGQDVTETFSADALFALIGAKPNTDWLPEHVVCDEKGFIVTGRDLGATGQLPLDWYLERRPMMRETSMPGVFAAGDVRRGSVPRVATAAGEGATVIQLVHEYLSNEHSDWQHVRALLARVSTLTDGMFEDLSRDLSQAR